MVGSQGVEPRVSQGRLVYSQLQSPMLLATHASGADEGARTPGLDVGNVAFYQTELRPQINYDVRSLDSTRKERERASKCGADDGNRTRDNKFGRLALCQLSYIRKLQSE